MKSKTSKTSKTIIVATTLAVGLSATGSSVFAQSTAAQIEGLESLTSSSSVAIPSPFTGTVTAILTEAGAVSGTHTYTTTSVLVQDSTGSLDVYGLSSTTYPSPTVGDSITVGSGSYSPYHQLPEVGSVGSLAVNSQGNAFSGPLIETLSTLNQDSLALSVAGYYTEIQNVTFASTTTLAGYAGGNVSLTMTDATGTETLYDWVTSYSAAAALAGTTLTAGVDYDVYGVDSVYGGTSPEFIPVAIVAVPEPAGFGFIGAGALAFVALARRKAYNR